VIRVVVEHSSSLYGLLGLFDNEKEELPIEMCVDDVTYYKSEVKVHFALYKRALSGWGAASRNPADPRPVFDARQR
jgi:hypothetical protein